MNWDLNLHQKAIEALNAKAITILDLLQPFEAKERAGSPSWMAEAYIAGHVHVPHVQRKGPVELRLPSGRLAGVEVNSADIHEAIPPRDISKLTALVEQTFSKQSGLRAVSTYEFVEKAFLRWLEAYRTRAIDEPWTGYLRSEVKAALAEKTIGVPLSGIKMPFQELRLGAFTLSQVTRATMADMLSFVPDDVANRQELEIRLRRELQGSVMMMQTFFGVESFRRAEALRAADKFTGVLRFWHPANLDVDLVSRIGRLGTVPQRKWYVLEQIDGRLSPPSSGLTDDEVAALLMPLVLGQTELSILGSAGLFRVLSWIDGSVQPTSFQDELLHAIIVFGRGSIGDAADRLLHAFSALESLLRHKHEGEITDTIAKRLAYLTGKTLQERRETVEAVKAAYDLRSVFVHSGRRPQPNESDTINRCLRIGWQAIADLIVGDLYASKDDLIRSLKDRELA